jgi:hypothetical protein
MIRPTAVIIAAVLLLGPLLVAEFRLRDLIESDRLPVAPSSSDFSDVSLANARRVGKSDVLVVGASTLRNALKPRALERLIGEATGKEVHVQSVAQGGISMATQLLLVQALADEDLLPSTVITGVSPVSLAGGFPPEGDWLARSDLGQLWTGCSDDVLDPEMFECRLGQVSALWRWRGHPDDVARALLEPMPKKLVDGGRELKPDGWISARPSNPKKLDEQLPRALERMETEVLVPDDVVEGFTDLVEYLRAQGVEVVALRMPYWAELEAALVERNPDWQTQRDAAYERLSEAADIELLELSAFGDVAKTSWFRDPRHLSRLGAGPFTRRLWKMAEFREPILQSLASAG